MSPRTGNRDLIIRTAERIFALEGVHTVSLRSINSAAGQRNNAALYYHFKSRANLIEAVLESRSSLIRETRERRLQALAAGATTPTVQFYLDALVGPLAELLEDNPGGLHFLMIIQQLIDESGDYPHPVPGRGDFDGEPELVSGLVHALENLPPHLAQLRVGQALLHSSHALAQRAHHILQRPAEEPGSALHLSNLAFVANMVDMLMGGLLAPASRAALS